MNIVCISTKISTPKSWGDKTRGAPPLQKLGGTYPLPTHGSTPMAWITSMTNGQTDGQPDGQNYDSNKLRFHMFRFVVDLDLDLRTTNRQQSTTNQTSKVLTTTCV